MHGGTGAGGTGAGGQAGPRWLRAGCALEAKKKRHGESMATAGTSWLPPSWGRGMRKGAFIKDASMKDASSGGWVPPVKGVSIASKEIEATLGLQLWL